MTAPSSRYAQALLSLASSPEEADGLGDVLKDFAAALESHDEFRMFMLSPAVPGRAKKEAQVRLLKAGSPKHAANFLSLLADKGRTDLLPGISREYDSLKAQRRGLLIITVFSAEALDGESLKTIGDKYARVYGSKSVRVEARVDKSLLGGVCVQIGDIRIDDTLAGRLKNLRLELAR